MKLKLSALVIFSAILSYFAVVKEVNWLAVLMLFLGGFLITGASNGFNQVMEKELDKLMNRTKNRPLPTSRLNNTEALIFCFLCTVAGIALLWFFTNPLSALLGLLSVILYTLVYTPLKLKTPFAVFVGAFPGALPPMIGAVAATQGFGELKFVAWVLFFVQFMWQFPHFWAIAWVSHDDYQRAGFFMLPTRSGRSKNSAFQILIYALFLIPISIMPSIFRFTGWISGGIIFVCGIIFFLQALKLYKECSIEAARKLMFGSFFYLPIVQLLIMAGRWMV
ncbi:MAG: protoheme IX farnesyltransferase [Bacteroidia bacterium]|nr:protoheme IX farnesyltransferase [Bacteroidia bacterium]